MLCRKLIETSSHVSTADKSEGDISGPYRFGGYGYGKESVKVMHVIRNGLVHSMKEFEVSTRLKLDSKKDYIQGNIVNYNL
jgi:urate oxidase